MIFTRRHGPSSASLFVDARLATGVEEALEKIRAGEPIDIEGLAGRDAVLAEELDKLLPAMRVLAELGSSGAAARDAADPAGTGSDLPPYLLGDFRLLREIGRGGMGVVYEAEQISLKRHVALKILPLASVLDSRQIQRFCNEVQAVAQLQHENIVPVFSVGCERGVHHFAMQLIDGVTLDAFIRSRARELEESSSRRRKPGEFRRAAWFGVQAARALQHAHELGILHRDIKPSNLLLDSSDHLWVSDFGLARLGADSSLTLSGDLIGTLRYMSPEQVLSRHGVVDQRSDIYSLGATLHELLTLRPAFPEEDREELLRKIIFEDPVPCGKREPTIPPDLRTIVGKAMAKSPAERYETAGELAADLERFLDGRLILARPPSILKRLRRWARRRRVLIATSLIVVLSIAVASFFLLADVQRRSQQRYEAIVEDALVQVILLDFRRDSTGPFSRFPMEPKRDHLDAFLEAPLKRSLRSLEEVIRDHPGRPEAPYLLARALRLQGRREEALSTALAVKNFLPARFLAGILAEELGGDGGPARDEPEFDALESPWLTSWLRMQRARQRRDHGGVKAAGTELLARIEARGREPYLGAALEAHLDLAGAHLALGETMAAIKHLGLIRYRWPRLVEPGAILGTVLIQEGQRQQANVEFASLHAPPRDLDTAAHWISVCYHSLREYQRALQWAEKMAPSSHRESVVSELLHHLGRAEEALERAEEAVRLDPRNAMAYKRLAFQLFQLDRLDAAIRASYRACELEPQNSWFRCDLGLLLLVRGQPDDIIHASESLLEVLHTNSHDGEMQSIAREGLRRLIAPLRMLREERPGDVEPLVLLARAEAAAGDMSRAMRCFAAALDVPEPPPGALQGLRKVLPSFSAIDSGLKRSERLLSVDEEWRYLRGIAEPSGHLDWAGYSFDVSGWEKGRGGFGYDCEGELELGTSLTDMQGSYTTLYLRREFELEAPARYTRLWLEVLSDDGFLALVNGSEVGRHLAGEPGAALSHEAVADRTAPEPPVSVSVPIDAKLLRPGRNVIALQGLNSSLESSDFVIACELWAEPAPVEAEDREILDLLLGVENEIDESPRLLYLRGRIEQRARMYTNAATSFTRLRELEPRAAEPLLRLVEVERALGTSDPIALQEELLDAITAADGPVEQLWSLWHENVFLELHYDASRALDSLPTALRRGLEHGGADLIWLLERLAEDRPVRINCGGREHRGADRVLWGEDRFSHSGRSPPPRKKIAMADWKGADLDLHGTELHFKLSDPPPYGYRIPLPPGLYRVALHFAEVWYREPGKRSFDVLLEGATRFRGVEPPIDRVDVRSLELRVEDGTLDLEFRHRIDNPKISAIEIELIGSLPGRGDQ